MSKRLQVVLSDGEMAEVRSVSEAQRMTVAEWVRQALRKERLGQPTTTADRKLQCVREAAAYAYPTAKIGDMLQEIERGRSGSGHK
jgi:hypothetical protein